VSFSDTVNTTFTPNTLSFTLTHFDPTLGTLTGLLIEFSADLDGEFSAQNLSNSDGILTGTTSGMFTLDGPAPLAMPLLTLNAVENLGPRSILAGETVLFSVLDITDSDSYATSAALELAPFIGAGNVAFGGTATALASPIGNFTPLLFAADLSGEATVKITYEYDRPGVPEVPEPMTLYLMGGGLLALSFMRRPRSAKESS
jgi:hypothetical protein